MGCTYLDDIILKLENITKSFTGQEVLQGISLEVKKGEFITLLGSSGCGKTTTLRIIAGLEEADSGTVFLQGQDVTNTPAHLRDVNTVFQNYALFPHMNVETNVAYSLKLKKKSREEIKKAVDEVLELVVLTGFEKRMPGELSGGQRQRVAIARAIVNRPHVLLLDEPLGALDLQLRRQMQTELKHLQKRLGITFIYITHDQEEALNMSDRIVVMRGGAFEQIGTPDEVYNRPKTSFVAQFVGGANILNGKVVDFDEEYVSVQILNHTAKALSLGKTYEKGDDITLAIRTESIEFCDTGLEAVVKEATFAGGMMCITLTLTDGTEIVARRHGINLGLSEGDVVHVCFCKNNAVPTLNAEAL